MSAKKIKKTAPTNIANQALVALVSNTIAMKATDRIRPSDLNKKDRSVTAKNAIINGITLVIIALW